MFKKIKKQVGENASPTKTIGPPRRRGTDWRGNFNILNSVCIFFFIFLKQKTILKMFLSLFSMFLCAKLKLKFKVRSRKKLPSLWQQQQQPAIEHGPFYFLCAAFCIFFNTFCSKNSKKIFFDLFCNFIIKKGSSTISKKNWRQYHPQNGQGFVSWSFFLKQ